MARLSHTEYQLHSMLELAPDHTANITLQSDRPFSEEQRLAMELILPHLLVAYQRLAQPELLQDLDERLSRREHEVIPLILEGMSNSEIASMLSLSSRTVEKHVASILEKGGFSNRTALIIAVLKAKAG